MEVVLRAQIRPCVASRGLALLALACLACADCDRSGCEAYAEPAGRPINQGVAGVVAHETDVVENGCQECGFTSAHMRGWLTPTLVTTEAEAGMLSATTATFDLDSGAHYYRSLDAGHYLLCLAHSEPATPCVSFTIAPEQVTTVNVKLIEGPAKLLVFDAGSATPRETTTFSAPAAI